MNGEHFCAENTENICSTYCTFICNYIHIVQLFNCIFYNIRGGRRWKYHARLKRRNESDKHRINSSRTAFVSNAFWFEWNASHCNPSLSFSFCLTIALSLIRSLYPAENYFAELQDKEIVHKSNIIGKSNKLAKVSPVFKIFSKIYNIDVLLICFNFNLF